MCTIDFHRTMQRLFTTTRETYHIATIFFTRNRSFWSKLNEKFDSSLPIQLTIQIHNHKPQWYHHLNLKLTNHLRWKKIRNLQSVIIEYSLRPFLLKSHALIRSVFSRKTLVIRNVLILPSLINMVVVNWMEEKNLSIDRYCVSYEFHSLLLWICFTINTSALYRMFLWLVWPTKWSHFSLSIWSYFWEEFSIGIVFLG